MIAAWVVPATTAVLAVVALLRGTGWGRSWRSGLIVAVARAPALRAHARRAAPLRRMRAPTGREKR
ncbi:hypothetical protein GBF35_23745 [Nonomuraea phyllanthi]|uniref:hypothetical protein n=1 Tax=Nonomuraea phyllanthi TaxID=2219224 RepID=UPI00129326F4|nr:hypothetical protein [Nonomuraea phyllanthi]QFY09273.1 hypothetical protein GBF35_23745 [Nonomuraea phyllanthi]